MHFLWRKISLKFVPLSLANRPTNRQLPVTKKKQPLFKTWPRLQPVSNTESTPWFLTSKTCDRDFAACDMILWQIHPDLPWFDSSIRSLSVQIKSKILLSQDCQTVQCESDPRIRDWFSKSSSRSGACFLWLVFFVITVLDSLCSLLRLSCNCVSSLREFDFYGGIEGKNSKYVCHFFFTWLYLSMNRALVSLSVMTFFVLIVEQKKLQVERAYEYIILVRREKWQLGFWGL